MASNDGLNEDNLFTKSVKSGILVAWLLRACVGESTECSDGHPPSSLIQKSRVDWMKGVAELSVRRLTVLIRFSKTTEDQYPAEDAASTPFIANGLADSADADDENYLLSGATGYEPYRLDKWPLSWRVGY